MCSLEAKLGQSSCWADLDALADFLDAGSTAVSITPEMAPHGVNSSMLRPQKIADVLTEFEARFGQGKVLLIPFSVPQPGSWSFGLRGSRYNQFRTVLFRLAQVN